MTLRGDVRTFLQKSKDYAAAITFNHMQLQAIALPHK
jgi:hypothetical protein